MFKNLRKKAVFNMFKAVVLLLVADLTLEQCRATMLKRLILWRESGYLKKKNTTNEKNIPVNLLGS